MEKIIKLEIVDKDLSESEQVLDVFYLIKPEISKLKELKKLVERRYDDDNDFRDYGKIIDFINENFKTLGMGTFIINW